MTTILPLGSVVASHRTAYIKTLTADGWRETGKGGRLKDVMVAALIADGTLTVVRVGDGG